MLVQENTSYAYGQLWSAQCAWVLHILSHSLNIGYTEQKKAGADSATTIFLEIN